MGRPPVDHLGMAEDRDRVQLVIDRFGVVDAIVARMVPGAAELRLVGRAPAPMHVLHRRTARTHSVDRDPAEVMTGTVLAVPGPGGAVRDDIVHFLFADVVEEALAAVAAAR